MIDVQEWQQENSIRAYPFSGSIFNQTGSVPPGFIVDVRFTPDRGDTNVYLSYVAANLTAGTYTIKFSYVSDNSQAIYFVANMSLPIGQEASIVDQGTNPYSSALITPGPQWPTGAWAQTQGAYNGSISSYECFFNASQAQLDSSVVNPGAQTLRRIFIQPDPHLSATSQVPAIPPQSAWGKNVHQQILGGYNISITPDTVDPTVLVLDSVPGAGDGYVPPGEGGGIISINGEYGTSTTSSLNLTTQDCLMHVENPVATNSNGVTSAVPNTIQIISNCIPCCSCEQYRAVSAAITRRSSKLSAMCNSLSSMIVANAALYNEAVAAINANRIPIAQTRNFRVFQNSFKITVQNVCNIPLYINFCVTVVSGLTINPTLFGLYETGSVTNDIGTLAPLAGTSKDYTNLTPDLPAGEYPYFTNTPVNPGSYQDFTFVYTGGVFDLRATNLTISVQTNGIYGALKTYGCKKDVYSAQVVESAPITSNNCSTPVTINTYAIKQLVP